MSKSINLFVNGKTVDELSREFQKVFYRKAALIENKGKIFLQSYAIKSSHDREVINVLFALFK